MKDDTNKKNSKIKEFMRNAFSSQDDYDEEYGDDYENEPQEKANNSSDYQKRYAFDDISSNDSSTKYASAPSFPSSSSSYGRSMSYDSGSIRESTSSSAGNLYKMTGKPKFRLSILRLEKLEDVVKVADDILSENTITLVDLRYVPKDVLRRIIDFIDGVRYTNKAKMETVADYTYVVVPKDVEMTGDLLSQLDTGNM